MPAKVPAMPRAGCAGKMICRCAAKAPAKARAQVQGGLIEPVPGGVRAGGPRLDARTSAREAPIKVCGQDWL